MAITEWIAPGSTRLQGSPPAQPPEEGPSWFRELGRKIGAATREVISDPAFRAGLEGRVTFDLDRVMKTIGWDDEKRAKAQTLAEFMRYTGMPETAQALDSVEELARELKATIRQAYQTGIVDKSVYDQITDPRNAAIFVKLVDAALWDSVGGTAKVLDATGDQMVLNLAGLLLSNWSDLLTPASSGPGSGSPSTPVVKQAPYLPIRTVPGVRVNAVEASPSTSSGGGGGFGRNCKVVNGRIVCPKQ